MFMRRKRFLGLSLMAALLIGLLGGCGDNTKPGNAGEAGEQPREETTGQQESGQQEVSESTESQTADALVGEWEFLCNIYHSDYSDGDSYDYVVMCTDDNTPDSRINIKKDGDKYLADYLYQEYEYDCMIYGGPLQYKVGAAYEDAENTSWYMELANPFADEDTDESFRSFSIMDNDCLVVSREYRSEPDAEYPYYSISKDYYLRKDSPKFDDPENLRYFDTVTVSDPVELLNSIQNNRRIIVKEGVYNFTDILSKEIDNDHIGELYGAYEVNNIFNLCIEAEEGADVQFCIDDPYADVVSFSGGANVTVRGITVGHTVEPGYCSGSVLHFYSVDGIDIDQCKLYGSGTYGVEAEYSYNINVTNTDIYECTYGLVSMQGVSSVLFKNCTMRDSKDMSMICLDSAYDVVFEDCDFMNNVSDAFDNVYFVEIGEYDSVAFRNCTFVNNKYPAFSNLAVEMENCTSDNNRAAFSDLLTSSVSGENIDKDTILENYEATKKRQEEIDEKLQTDTLLDQSSLNKLAGEEYKIWDQLLNQIWAYLEEKLETADMDVLREEQRKWIREKEASMQEAGSAFEGGTMKPMVEYGAGASATHKRVDELMERYVN